MTLEPTVEAHTRLSGIAAFEMVNGLALKIETSPDGVEILNADVPEGKKWDVAIQVTVTETDA